MKRTSLADIPCSIARTLDVAGDWWTPLILRDIAYGVRRFTEIQRDLGIAANVLADRLEALVADGLLETRVYQRRPERREYRLTEMGSDLIPVLIALKEWGDRWRWPHARGPVRVLHDDCGGEVHLELRCEHCGGEVPASELRAKLRDGVADVLAEGALGAVSARRLSSSPGGRALAG
jgi:DNA-binding HxlR family transcriptional regulator